MSVPLLVGLRGQTRTLTQTLARLYGVEVEEVRTAEEALRRPPEGPIFTRFRLPRMDGAALARAAQQAEPLRRVVLYSARPLAGPEGQTPRAPRFRQVAPSALAAILEAFGWATEREVLAAYRGWAEALRAGPEALSQAFLTWARGPRVEPDVPEAQVAVGLVASCLPPALALAHLSAALQGAPGVAPAILDLLPRFQGDALSIALALAEDPRVAPAQRASALRLLGAHHPLSATAPRLLALLDDRSTLVRAEAAGALYAAAVRSAARRDQPRLEESEAYRVLLELAQRDGLDDLLRCRALELLAKEAPPGLIGPRVASLAKAKGSPVQALAASLQVRADGVEVESLRQVLEDQGRSSLERRSALEVVARSLPEAHGAPLLQRAQAGADRALAARAFELYFASAESGFQSALLRARALGSWAERAATLGALEHGAGGVNALVAIARSDFAASQVIAALRVLGVRGEPPEVGPLLRQALADPRPEVAEAAFRGLLQLDERGLPERMRAIADPTVPTALRIRLLEALVDDAEPGTVRAAAARLAKDAEPTLAAAAVAAVIASGAVSFEVLATRLGPLGQEAHYQGWIEGARALGAQGFGALAYLLEAPSAPAWAKERAIRQLRADFTPAERAELFRRHQLPVEAPSHTAPYVGPPRPVESAEAFDRAPTRPVPPAGAPPSIEGKGPRRRRRPGAGVQGEPGPTEVAGPAPSGEEIAAHEGTAQRSTPQAAPRPGDSAPIPRPAPSRPEAPAAPASPGIGGPQALPPIPSARALEVLKECLRQGPSGLRGLKLLALSPRVPEEVRAAALRHLASDFSEADQGDTLVRALAGPTTVQATALGCLLVKRDPPRGPLELFARDPRQPVELRLKALRFLAARFGRGEVAPLLLEALECGQPDLERAALECLFTSIRFTPELAVEDALCNLLREHQSLEVKTWAAQALGTFGTKSALPHLEHFTGLFGEAEVKAVARRARARIQARLKG